MAKMLFALEKGGVKRLEVSWKGLWREINISLDGSPVGTIPDQNALVAGQIFSLPDGSKLSVQLIKKFGSNELQILRNGEPLPGSASDPDAKVKSAAGIVFFIAGLNLVLGLVSVLFQIELLQSLGLCYFSILFGFVFLLLGFFIRRRSSVALILAIAIFTLDGLIGIISAVTMGYTPGISGIFVRIFLLIPMIQGVSAIKELKVQNR
jgi:hypothetical protein